jgi:hypothetical protein
MATSKKSSRSSGSRGSGASSSSKSRTSSTRGKSGSSSSSSKTNGRSSSGARRSAKSLTTTDHEQIREWAEARGGKPSCVRGTGDSKDVGLLRIDFPGYGGKQSLQKISWDDFFEKFDEQGLALLYQEKTKDGQASNFNKLVSRRTAKSKDHGRSSLS